VARELDYILEVDFVLEALYKALYIGKPEIVKSDREASLPASVI
jgi:hypothetical protein